MDARELKTSACLMFALLYAGVGRAVDLGWLVSPWLVWPVAVVLLLLFLLFALTEFGEMASVVGAIVLALFGGGGAESPVPLPEMALGAAVLVILSVPVRILVTRMRERRS